MADSRIKIEGKERSNPDLRRIARALIDLAIAQAEAETNVACIVETDQAAETKRAA